MDLPEALHGKKHTFESVLKGHFFFSFFKYNEVLHHRFETCSESNPWFPTPQIKRAHCVATFVRIWGNPTGDHGHLWACKKLHVLFQFHHPQPTGGFLNSQTPAPFRSRCPKGCLLEASLTSIHQIPFSTTTFPWSCWCYTFICFPFQNWSTFMGPSLSMDLATMDLNSCRCWALSSVIFNPFSLLAHKRGAKIVKILASRFFFLPFARHTLLLIPQLPHSLVHVYHPDCVRLLYTCKYSK